MSLDQKLRWLTGQEITGVRRQRSRPSRRNLQWGWATSESAQVLCTMSGGSAGLVSLGRRFPPGDACWTQVFGTKGSEECRFLWPPDGDTAFHPGAAVASREFCRIGERRRGMKLPHGEDAVKPLTVAELASGMVR